MNASPSWRPRKVEPLRSNPHPMVTRRPKAIAVPPFPEAETPSPMDRAGKPQSDTLMLMRVFFASISIAVFAFAQPPSTGTASSTGPCSPPIVGNSNTVTMTCSNLDKTLAGQFAQLAAISKRSEETLQSLSAEIEQLLRRVNTPGAISQSNSGGVNIQQATTGSNSPIVNSPITVGKLPKHISPEDMATIIAYFKDAPVKSKVTISADQISGGETFPDDFYDALSKAGWVMVEGGVIHYVGFAPPGRPFQGAIITVKGEPSPGEPIAPSDPIMPIIRSLEAFGIPVRATRNPKSEDGVVAVNFEGGFPR